MAIISVCGQVLAAKFREGGWLRPGAMCLRAKAIKGPAWRRGRGGLGDAASIGLSSVLSGPRGRHCLSGGPRVRQRPHRGCLMIGSLLVILAVLLGVVLGGYIADALVGRLSRSKP